MSLLYPHWVPAANYGAGEPRFVFYPPLSWALGALLDAVLPWTWVPQVFTWQVLAGCGLGFYVLARRWVSPGVAAGAACVYLANPYLLFVAYERTAYGELLGAVWMPLVVLYALRRRPAVIRLALVVAALWLTNAPAAVMGSYLVGACAFAAAVATRRWAPVVRSAGALLLGVGAGSVYVLPAWYEQRWVEIARVVGPGMRVEDSFLFGRSGEAFHDQVLHTASWIAVAVLGVGLVGAGVGWAALRKGCAGAGSARLRWVIRAAAGLMTAIFVLLLPASELVWHWAPELRFLQFPWRWLLVGGLAAALAVAVAAEAVVGRWVTAASKGGLRRAGLAARIGCLVVLLAGAWRAGRYAQAHYAQSCDEEDNVRAQERLLPSPAGLGGQRSETGDGGGFEGTDEYTPRGADNGEVRQGLPAVRLLRSAEEDEGDDSAAPNPEWQAPQKAFGRVRVNEWAAEEMQVTLTAAAPAYAVLRLMDYPAWQVLVDEQPLVARPHREDGLLTVPVPAGTSRIQVRYRATGDVYAGRAVSLVSLVLLGGLALRRRGRTE